MTIQESLELSYYTRIADIEPEKAVYLVQDSRSRKIYVQKILSVYNMEIYRSLLENPIRHTPKIEALAQDKGLLYLVEEYIPGDTLQELLDTRGLFDEEQVIDIALQLCSILESFHACTPPIVNRDIKPSNIKLTPDGIVKLLDLNAAKRCGSGAKDTVLLGTQGYAAPEQYGFGASNIQTDIYSMGVLMNVLLTGCLPGERLYPGRLGRIISKCTRLSPDSRPQSMEQLRRSLEALGSDGIDSAASWRRYLPPGFRSGNAVAGFFALLGYIVALYFCFTLQVKDATAVELFLNRAAITAIFIGIVLFSGNYLSVQEKLGIRGDKGIILKLLAVLAVDVLIMFAGLTLLSLIVSLL